MLHGLHVCEHEQSLESVPHALDCQQPQQPRAASDPCQCLVHPAHHAKHCQLQSSAGTKRVAVGARARIREVHYAIKHNHGSGHHDVRLDDDGQLAANGLPCVDFPQKLKCGY